jgi:hypothetical protein
VIATRHAVAACVLCAALPAALSSPRTAVTGAQCALVIAEQRSGREVARLPLDARAPAAQVAFTHSVLGTPVADRYEWRHAGDRWRAHLVEERYEGEGYGLAIAAGPGETLTREGDGWRLTLDRPVDPLVVRPSKSQGTRVQAEQAAVVLADLTTAAVELRIAGCNAR